MLPDARETLANAFPLEDYVSFTFHWIVLFVRE
jgi:hypothetical protein